MIEAKKMIKNGQEQAVASWINYLNQVRLDRLMEALQKEELNLNEAMSTIGETLKTIAVHKDSKDSEDSEHRIVPPQSKSTA